MSPPPLSPQYHSSLSQSHIFTSLSLQLLCVSYQTLEVHLNQRIMVALFLSSILVLAIAGHSNAAYCVCKQGMSEALLQKNIDYACGAGADCSPILQNGPCFNPNTVQDHCNWAVNSYYQRKGQTTGSCDFSGSATMSTTPPSQSSSCVYPASPGNGGSTGTPTTNPGTPTTVNPPPSTGTGIGAGTGTGTGTGTGSTGIPGTTGGFGLAPSGSSFGGIDNTNRGMTLQQTSNLLIATSLSILSSWLMLIMS